MKKMTNKNVLCGALLSLFVVLFGGCKKDENKNIPATPVDINYAIANVSGAYPSQTTYLQGLTDLSSTIIDNSKATESSSFSSMWDYKGAVYLSAFGAPATLNKYSFDVSGKAVSAGKLIVPGGNTFSSIEFLNDTVAYASVGGGLARVIVFNPKALQIIGEVNLNSLQKVGAASTYYLGMKARGSKLFMGVHYFKPNFDVLYDSAYIAVIDIATRKVDKLIADGRTSAVFIAGSSVNAFVLDENGDIYLQGTGSNNTPSGILRIKNGETNFDPAYFFNLKAATGKDCYGFYHFGAGQTFTCRINDATDPYEINGPNFEFYKIDLASKISLGKLGSLPKIYGTSTSIMRKVSSSEIVLVVSGANENAIYSYKTADGAVSKKITLTAGQCTGFAKIR